MARHTDPMREARGSEDVNSVVCGEIIVDTLLPANVTFGVGDTSSMAWRLTRDATTSAMSSNANGDTTQRIGIKRVRPCGQCVRVSA